MPRIPYGAKYTATLSGSKWKPVVCEYCGCQFLYRVRHSATGSADSILWLNNNGAKAKAYSRAEENLASYLDKVVRVYACPDCGFFQANMIREMKRRIWRKALGWGGGTLLGVFLLSMAVEYPSFILPLLAGLLVTLFLLRKLIGFDPNKNASKRKNKKPSEKYPVIRKSDLRTLSNPDNLLSSHQNP